MGTNAQHLKIPQLLRMGQSIDPAAKQHIELCSECRHALEELRRGMHLSPDDIAAFAANDLAEPDRSRVAHHLGQCRFCSRVKAELAHEPHRSSFPLRSKVPTFFGTYTLVPGPENDFLFASEEEQRVFVVAALRNSDERRSKLGSIYSAFEAWLVDLRRARDERRLRERHAAPFGADVSEAPTDDEEAAQAALVELRAKAQATLEVFEREERALRDRSHRRVGEQELNLSLGDLMQVELRAVKDGQDVGLRIEAKWPTGSPGRNIEVRSIAREPETIQSCLTDAEGRAGLRLARGRYKIELEHEVHGAGGLVLDAKLT